MANLSTQNIGTNFKGMLNLGSTINTPLSTTLQAITDGDGVASPLQLATNRIALGTSTGTGLLNFPDAGTTAADGISFGSGTANLYRHTSNNLRTDGNFNLGDALYMGGINLVFSKVGGSLKLNDNLSWSSLIFKGIYTIEGSTLTGSSSTSALSITQTWNTTGNPTAIFANITNTASGASANLMDLQVGGVSMFRVNKLGGIFSLGLSMFSNNVTFNTLIDCNGANNFRLVVPGVTKTLLVNHDYSNTPSASAILELQATSQGFLPPRMTTTQVNAIATPAEGLVVFNTTISHLCVYQSGAWVKLSHSPM